MTHQFHGDNPYVLIVIASEPVLIDLDEPGWASRYSDLMRKPGRWILARKDEVPILTMVVAEGEQPHYFSRLFGSASLPPPDALGLSQEQALDIKARAEVRAFCLGKKRRDGYVDRLWVLPNGVICLDNDVDLIANEMANAALRSLLAQEAHP